MLKGEITFDRFVRLLIAVLMFALGVWLLNFLSTVLLPFLLALVIAYIMNPLVELFLKIKWLKSRVLAVVLTLISVSSILTVIGLVIVPIVLEEGKRMGDLIQVYAQENHLEALLPESVDAELKKLLSSPEVKEVITLENGQKVAQKILPTVFGFFSESLQVLLGLLTFVIIALYLIFILIDYDKITGGWRLLIPERYRGNVGGLVYDLKVGMNKYFRAQAFKAAIIGTLFAIGFSIVGLPMAILMGLLFGLLNMVPYLQLIGVAPAFLLALLQSLEPGSTLWGPILGVLIVLVVIQIIEEVILTPKIMGDVTGLNPAIIMLSLSIWGALLGMIGLIIALPVTTLLLSYYQRFLSNEEIIQDKH